MHVKTNNILVLKDNLGNFNFETSFMNLKTSAKNATT
jgi:hypothetical protein